ncbi:protein TALPID3 [Archocentrus centrarchus]|uniref:protein TALPID3 n=1 Tax=Archocentrus centrarchus TaxID=63155 RepID=UPI0011EA3C6A|nr:protein TALPID3 [Archocentrus centrarchus]
MSAPEQSSCSLDTGDVLIRSTRALRPDRRPGSVQITVRKLRDPPPSPQTQKQKKQQRRSPRQQTGFGAPQRITADPDPGKKPGGGTQDPAHVVQSGDDVLTSRFASGSRGVVLAALKKRSQSAPQRREVRVQFLDPSPLHTAGNSSDCPALSSQDAVGDTGVQTLSSGHLGDTSNAAAAAAATAAAAAAAAPLIKAQSDMEARVAQLADGVQKLLQANREGGDRERSLNQQTLQHLETLHNQQLQLQSQLVESAIKIASGHASSTADPTASGWPGHLQLTHLNTAANSLGTQPPSSSPVAAPPAAPVTMETRRLDRWPDQTRDDRYLRDAPRVSMAERSQLQYLANHSWEAARRANDVLQEMKRLKTEMKMLLTQPEDPPKTTRPAPDHLQSQENQSYQTSSQENNFWSQSSHFQRNLSHENHLQSQQNQSQFQQSQFHQNQPHEKHLQLQKNHQSSLHHTESQQRQFQQNPSKSQLFQSHQTSDGENKLWSQSSQFQSQQSQSVLVQRRPMAPSLLEEAGQVLRQVRKQKKVLEENLEALLRARTGEVLQCQLEALAANRDHSNEVRIKKTVDAWISRLSRDNQAETSSGSHGIHRSIPDAEGSVHTGRGRPVSTLRGTGSSGRGTVRRGSRGQRAGVRVPQGMEPQLEADGESYLTRLYGRAPYDGLRRTLKKCPYLRLSSPGSPLRRKSRPRLVESVRGVKLKSCKTQTSLAPPLTHIPPLNQAQPIILAPPFASSSPGQPQNFSSSHLTSDHYGDLTVTPADSHPVTMAIPLGRRRMDSSSRCDREVTSPPAAPPTASVDDGAPELQEQHLDEAPPPLPPPSHTINIMEGNGGEEEHNVFPGADFLSVVDVVQQEASVSAAEAVELDGVPSPPPVLYQGPVFPPQAPSTLPAQDQRPILGIDLQWDSMEDRLVEWVEQQLMSRMISDLYHPPPSDPAQNNDTDQSDLEERSVTSDIVEAAGNAGLQLFVDSSVPVDSELIQQLVNEVLTEMIGLMLGQRDSLGTEPEPGQEPPEPEAAAHQENKLIPLVPTPEPTPPPSPAPPSRETTAVTTPPPSEPTSPLSKEPPQSVTAPELVATPNLSPEPAPSAGSPSAVHQAHPHFTWEDAELPLDEERQVEDVSPYEPPLLMSVAENVPPLSSHQSSPAPSSLPPAHSPSPPPEPVPASPSSSSEDSSSSSSSTVTAGTEAALKHISEGELLIGVNQLAAMTEGEAVCSFNSSLQELQDMDFDPPSEGQVKGRDLLRALLTKMEQGVTQRGERPQPEGSWGRENEEVSVGEVRDDQSSKPHRKPSSTQRDETCSPGQISHAADVSEVSFEATNQDSFTLGDPAGEPMGTLTSDFHTELSLSPPPYLENTHNPGQVLLVRKYDRHTANQKKEEGGASKTNIHRPLIRPQEEQEVMEDSLSVAADSGSSANDVF